jgi:tRNA (Thr-GGU) A37 N-methylase
MPFALEPVAHVKGGRAEATDDDWGSVLAEIVLAEALGPDAIEGLGAFSHAEIVYVFHREIVRGVRHPRGRKDWPAVGIFAQRGKNRPNRLGVSVCRILSVRERTIEVLGLDAIDGTPVLDIKPVLAGFAPRGEVREPPWAHEIMQRYW